MLVNGLGLGIVAKACLEKTNKKGHRLFYAVEKITVIEKSADVIHLVGPSYEKYGDRIEIINADALEYKPPKGVRYNVVWHDIWDNICSDNWETMKVLHRKYGRICEWQGSWCREEVKYNRRKEKYYESYS